MTDSNAIRLEDIGAMSPDRLDGLSIDDFALLYNELTEMKTKYDRYREFFNLMCDRRFSTTIRTIRNAQQRPSGVVRVKENTFEVSQDVSKRVKWNQEKLGRLDGEISLAGRDPREYIDVEYSVPEKRYSEWPDQVRESFEPARTVVLGNTNYKIETAKE